MNQFKRHYKVGLFFLLCAVISALAFQAINATSRPIKKDCNDYLVSEYDSGLVPKRCVNDEQR